MKKRTGKQVAKKLLEHGFERYTMKGSHQVMKKQELYVHVPMYKVLKNNTLKHIEKKSGIEL